MENIRTHRHQMASVWTDDDYADADDGRDGGGFSTYSSLISLCTSLSLSLYVSASLSLSAVILSVYFSVCLFLFFHFPVCLCFSPLCIYSVSLICLLSVSVCICLPACFSVFLILTLAILTLSLIGLRVIIKCIHLVSVSKGACTDLPTAKLGSLT